MPRRCSKTVKIVLNQIFISVDPLSFTLCCAVRRKGLRRLARTEGVSSYVLQDESFAGLHEKAPTVLSTHSLGLVR